MLFNQYAFAQNEPVNLNDPSGQFTSTEAQIRPTIAATMGLLGAGYGYVKATITGGDVIKYMLLVGVAGVTIGGATDATSNRALVTRTALQRTSSE